jgi:hypothetical protein
LPGWLSAAGWVWNAEVGAKGGGGRRGLLSAETRVCENGGPRLGACTHLRPCRRVHFNNDPTGGLGVLANQHMVPHMDS